MRSKPWSPVHSPAPEPEVIININPQVQLNIGGQSQKMGLVAALILAAGAMHANRPFSMQTAAGEMLAEYSDKVLRKTADPAFSVAIAEATAALGVVQDILKIRAFESLEKELWGSANPPGNGNESPGQAQGDVQSDAPQSQP